MLDKRQKIILFVGCFLFFGMFLDIRGVNAEYIPSAEAPVDVGDILIYDVQYNISGNYWDGYYKFVITDISFETGYSAAKLIKANWYSSDDKVDWCLEAQDLLVGKVSLDEVYFDQNTLFQHKFFRFDFLPSNGLRANNSFIQYIENEFDFTVYDSYFYDEEIYLPNYSNSTWWGNYDKWEFHYGILVEKEINLYKSGSSDRYEVNWELIEDDCYIESLKFNYWGVPEIYDTGFKVEDIFVYDINSKDSEGIEAYYKCRFKITDFEVRNYYILYMVTTQTWNSETMVWECTESDIVYSEYSLSMDIFHENEIIEEIFVPSAVNYLDEDYQKLLETRNYWDHIYDEDENFDIITFIDSKSLSINSSRYNSNGDYLENYFKQTHSEQGYLTRLTAYELYSDGDRASVNYSLNFEESKITPKSPDISTEKTSITENSTTISWDELDDADGYNIYTNDTLIGTTTDCSYELEFDEFGDYNVTVTGLGNERESDLSNSLVISYSEAVEEPDPNPNPDPEPDDPSVPGMSAWMIGLLSIITIASMYRITKKRIEME